MQKDINKINEILGEVLNGLKKVRCYTFGEILTNYVIGKIDADEALILLKEFNEKFKNLDVDKDKNPIFYRDFIKIGEIDIEISHIRNISKNKRYNFKDNKIIYELVINKASNDFNPLNNFTIKYDSEVERDKEYLRLRDLISILSLTKFN